MDFLVFGIIFIWISFFRLLTRSKNLRRHTQSDSRSWEITPWKRIKWRPSNHVMTIHQSTATPTVPMQVKNNTQTRTHLNKLFFGKNLLFKSNLNDTIVLIWSAENALDEIMLIRIQTLVFTRCLIKRVTWPPLSYVFPTKHGHQSLGKISPRIALKILTRYFAKRQRSQQYKATCLIGRAYSA